MSTKLLAGLLACSALSALSTLAAAQAPAPPASDDRRPNVVIIYADDLGYGDVSSYGATHVETPHIDRLAAQGLRFTDGHAPASTCTPSRFSMLTGEYAFREDGTGIARGNAALVIDPETFTLADLFRQEEYATGVVGKWHLGLGDGNVDWNGEIRPGPLELGFDHAFLIPATGDRTPTVYVENHHVVGLDPEGEPLRVSYDRKIGDEPTGRENPELLEMKLTHGHDQTIVNGISRIGYQDGGKSAWWDDATMADRLAGEAIGFIERNKDKPFFLFYSAHDIHVPRVPHPRFVGKTEMGPRGDAIVQFDWQVGQILQALEDHGLAHNTLVIVTSDNGPVMDDGYADQTMRHTPNRAMVTPEGHRPAGPFRGGKYSVYEGGTCVPFIVRWPAKVEAGASDALVSQTDFLASFADLLDHPLPSGAAPDSENMLRALLGESGEGRTVLVEQNNGAAVALRQGSWKLIPGGQGPQLYNLADDVGETQNLAEAHPDRVEEMRALLHQIRGQDSVRP